MAAIHGLDDPEAALAPLNETVSIIVENVPASAGIPEVRRRMLMAATDCDVEFLVLVDMDDYLLPEAINAHAAVMRDAEFSYGDMALIDSQGVDLGRTFYQECDIPPRLAARSGQAAILKRNFLGFSNTAVLRACVDPSWLAIPDDLVAVDWWFFTRLLQNGRNGVKTNAAVACYRTHADNVLDGRPDTDLNAVCRRIDINRRHCEAFAGDAAFDGRRATLDRLLQWIEREDDRVAAAIEAACAVPGVWFDDIARLADRARLS